MKLRTALPATLFALIATLAAPGFAQTPGMVGKVTGRFIRIASPDGMEFTSILLNAKGEVFSVGAVAIKTDS